MLKDLIATDGEAIAGRIIREFRFSGDAREEIYALVTKEVDERIQQAFQRGIAIGKVQGFERAGGRFVEL